MLSIDVPPSQFRRDQHRAVTVSRDSGGPSLTSPSECCVINHLESDSSTYEQVAHDLFTMPGSRKEFMRVASHNARLLQPARTTRLSSSMEEITDCRSQNNGGSH